MAVPLQPGIYIQELSGSALAIPDAATSVTAFLGTASSGPIDQAVLVFGFADYEQTFGGLSADSELAYSVRQFFINGGTEAWVVRVAQPSGLDGEYATFVGDRAQRRGLYALEDADFNLLCLPAVSNSDVLAAAASYCEERLAFLIVDSPRAATDVASMTQVATGSALPKSDLAAVYFPWTYVPDPLTNNAPRLTPPCGTIAGLHARFDADRGVWKAAAGADANLIGVVSLAGTVNDSENGALNPLGVNCLRTFPARGAVNWGARTLRGADSLVSEYKYVPVRRLALFLEHSLRGGLQWTVFEPNGEPLWAQIRQSAGVFMDKQFRRGAFQGALPRDAYFVKCDGTTTTQSDIDQEMVSILVGFAPLRPAEFIILNLRLPAGRTAP